MNRRYKLLAAVLLFLVAFSCVPATQPTTETPKPTTKLTPEEQNDLAMVEFEGILDLIVNEGKSNVLPQIEEIYLKVINDYPDAFLAEESYWRLIVMNLVDYSPSRMDRADQLRQEFLEKYPDSQMLVVIDDSMGRIYYKKQEWKRLHEICKIHIRKFLDSGSLETPLFMFFYSEAKYNLNDHIEAKKGFKIVIRKYPGSKEAEISSQRLDEIKAITGN